VDRKDELEDAFADEFDSMVMDLSNTDKVPLQLSRPKPKNEVKLSAYQCVICMDDVSGLTVTHCGHLFCGECLHSSLTVDLSKKICPICRTKIDAKAPGGKFRANQKGYYPLELKLLTRKKLGSRS